MDLQTRRNVARLELLEDRTLFAAFVVTNVADDGVGSLRWALTQSNNTPGVDRITFDITGTDKTIRPKSALPIVYDPATIDATTQPGYAGKPLVRIDGAGAGATDGLKLFGNDTLQGLDVTGFNGQGITTIPIANSGYGGNVIRANWVGVDLSGAAAANTSHDVGIYSPGNTVDRNVLGSSGGAGVWVMGNIFNGVNGNNTISNNYIGLDPTGTQARGTVDGVGIQDSPNDVVTGNVIGGNRDDGILVQGTSSNVVIRGNYIGTDKTGARAVANGLYGIEDQSDHGTIGGALASQRNIIAGNVNAGIVFWLSGAHDNLVQNNYIGTDVTGTHALGNGQQGIAFSDAGSTLVTGNVICANGEEGVGIFPGGDEVLTGNRIGVNAAGDALGNATWGVTVINNSSGCVIGGAAAGAGNLIAGNGRDAIYADAGDATIVGNTTTLPSVAHPATVTFATSAVTVKENARSITLKVTRTGSSDGAATVHFATANGSGVKGVNYTATSGTITFKAGQVSKTITIPIVDDGAVTADTYFRVTLSSLSGASAGAAMVCRVTVQNTDVSRRRRR